MATLLTCALVSCGTFENEGRADEAEAALGQYLDDLAGESEDRGWSRLSESMRMAHGPREDYVERARQAADADLAILAIRLVYEDDGFYEFAVTITEPIDPAYAELLFRPVRTASAIACRTDQETLGMAVLIAPFSEFNGVTGQGCGAGK
jgi:hypothetical protein